MFEQLDEPRKAPRVSIAMSLGIFAAYMAGAFGGLLLFILLGEKRFGIQIASAITYTYFAFWYVFFPTRGLEEKYSLQNKIIQMQIPRLLGIHCAFLFLIFLGQSAWFAIRPNLLSRRLVEGTTRGTPWVMLVFLRRPILRSGPDITPNPQPQPERRSGQIWIPTHVSAFQSEEEPRHPASKIQNNSP
jgi:hypothetical protein